MKTLTKEQLLTKDKLELKQVDLGDDFCVYVRQMTGKDRDAFEQSVIKEKRNNKGQVEGYDTVLEGFRTKLIVFTACDEQGNLLFDLREKLENDQINDQKS